MCGIAGAMVLDSSSPFRITATYLDALRDSMAHRGPDGCGTWVSGDGMVGLAHRRLSIIDTSAAAGQPMANPDRTVLLSYNGEIYNHREVRRELQTLGRLQWQTDHSDTEVILQAYEEWGVDCLQRLRGMFAFALWDATRQRLWLVRDRLGIKPLYYSRHHGRIVFASEIKALLRDPEQPRAVDEESLFHYLSFLTTPAPMTLFAGVRKLAAGTWLLVEAGGATREQRYWDPYDGHLDLRRCSDAEIAEMILAELRTAVRLHKESDVPVGVFLSGGIDSSTNTALFADGAREPVRTFSIGYRGEYASYRNELDYARRMADTVGAQYHERLLDLDDLLDFLPAMVRLQDEPIADPVCVPVYYVAKLARDNGVTVCQVGEGADELFWGYPSWRTFLRLQQADDLPVPSALKALGLRALAAGGRAASLQYEMLRRGAAGVPVFWSGAEAFNDHQKHALLGERLRAGFRGRTSWEVIQPVHERWRERAWEHSPLHWMSYADLNLRLPELLLMRVDKMTMGVSLESRVPFLDHRFVELAMSIPQAVKTRNGQLKSVLKKAVRGVIPDEMIDRPKQGFGVPVHEWLAQGLGDRIRTDLDAFCRETDLLDRDSVMRVVDSGDASRAWYLLNLALWHREYIA